MGRWGASAFFCLIRRLWRGREGEDGDGEEIVFQIILRGGEGESSWHGGVFPVSATGRPCRDGAKI